jgi:hypothetical protein
MYRGGWRFAIRKPPGEGKEADMAKLSVVKGSKTATSVIGNRIYAFARETKGCWVYAWADAPDETPDWAKKWYILKSDYPVKPGDHLDVTMAV